MSDILVMTARFPEVNLEKAFDETGFLKEDRTVFKNEKGSYIFGFSAKDSFFKYKDEYLILNDGSIYNKKEVIAELIEKGVSIKPTASDAEVILYAYVTFGKTFIEKLNGDFAFVIYDTVLDKIEVYRDRIGNKSVCYSVTPDFICLSTSINYVASIIPSSKEYDELAIQYYFRLGYMPSPHTVYKDIKKVGAGSVVRFAKGTVKSEKYWKVEDQIKKEVLSDEATAKEQLHVLIRESVKSRLDGIDKPGVFLSGGIDSSTMASIAQSLSKKPIHTFSIGFKDHVCNESEHAKEISNHLGTIHKKFMITAKDVKDLVLQIPKWYGEPYADASALPTYLAAQLAKQDVDVILTGDGGDEQFMGYGMYTWADRLYALKNARGILKCALRMSPNLNHKRASEYFNYDNVESIPTHIFSVEQGFFTAKQLKSHFQFKEDFVPLSFPKTERTLKVSETQALFDLRYYLPGELTIKVERALKQWDLGARAPLLDYNLLKWSLNLDEKLKRKNGTAKYLLKQVLYDYVPEALFDRPKWGFGIPLYEWLRGELKPYLDAYVNKEVLENYPFYNVEEVLKLKAEFLKGNDSLAVKMWTIMMFNIWEKSA